MPYSPRSFGQNPLYKILSHHWETFRGIYEERFQKLCGALRNVVEESVGKFLECGNPKNGFARIRCVDCGHEKILPFSCKRGGLCPSCHARRAAQWADYIAEQLTASVRHRHLVFTIPKMLRAYFRYDRSLMAELGRAANRTIEKYLELALGREVTPGVIVVKQLFGRGLRFHPHLHVLLTDGGYTDEAAFMHVAGWDSRTLRDIFKRQVFAFLLDEGLITKQRIELIESWRHSGFDVYAADEIQANDNKTLRKVARYIFRAPVCLRSLQYDPDNSRVIIHQKKSPAIELDVMDFIARLSLQIPDPYERLVTYFGVYSSASKLREQVTNIDGTSKEAETEPTEQSASWRTAVRRAWAALIKRVWNDDPLECNKCGGDMRIIAFITDYRVIDKILAHVGWTHNDGPSSSYHPPPTPSSAPIG